jgi:hypothetical protein
MNIETGTDQLYWFKTTRRTRCDVHAMLDLSPANIAKGKKKIQICRCGADPARGTAVPYKRDTSIQATSGNRQK